MICRLAVVEHESIVAFPAVIRPIVPHICTPVIHMDLPLHHVFTPYVHSFIFFCLSQRVQIEAAIHFLPQSCIHYEFRRD